MTAIIGRGRYARETYPEPRFASSSPGGSCPPMLRVIYVGATDPATTTPDGSQCAPYPTLAAGIAAAAAILVDIAPTIAIMVADGDYEGEGVLALPNDGKTYIFQALGVANARFSLDCGTSNGLLTYVFRNMGGGLIQTTVVSNGAEGCRVRFNYELDRAIQSAENDNGNLQQIPGIDDTAFTGTSIKVTTVGGRVTGNWVAEHTDVSAFGTVFGYELSGSLQLTMFVRSFEQIDSCHFVSAALSATTAPSSPSGGAPGFTSCLFQGALSAFIGGPGSFVIDNLTASSYVANIGSLPSPQTVQLEGAGSIRAAYASRPAAGLPSRRFTATDGVVEFIDSGTEWKAYVDGVERDQIPLVAGFTQVGVTATWTDVAGTIRGSLAAAAATQRAEALVQIYGLGASITRTLSLDVMSQTADASIGTVDAGSGAGLAFYDTVTGELVVFAFGIDSADANSPGVGSLSVRPWTNSTTKQATVAFQNTTAPKALRASDNGVNYTFEVSPDGRNFVPFHTMAKLANSRGLGPCVMRTTDGSIPVLGSFKAFGAT